MQKASSGSRLKHTPKTGKSSCVSTRLAISTYRRTQWFQHQKNTPTGCHFQLAQLPKMVNTLCMKIRGQKVHTPKERIRKMVCVDQDTKCWNWQGTTRNGYGRMIVGSRTKGTRRSESAHRYAYTAFIGEIPEGIYVCHQCDNRACCNPSHLFLGTHQDNMDDRDAKGRNKLPPTMRGENHPKAKLTQKDVDWIRSVGRKKHSNKELSAIFDMSPRAIRDVLSHRSWNPAPPMSDK